MPVIKSAKKKLKQDKLRTLRNKKIKEAYKKAVKKVATAPTAANVIQAVSLVDKAVKANIIHKNKGGRLKSKLSKALLKKKGASAVKKSAAPKSTATPKKTKSSKPKTSKASKK